MQDISLKLGPLGKVTIQKMVAQIDIDKGGALVSLKGNFGGQVVEVTLSGATLSVNVPADCVNPFEIKTSLAIQVSTNIANVFEGQGGVNVDPSKITGCVGAQVEAALNKVAGEYKNLSGYTASAANAQLNQIHNAAAHAAAVVAAQAQKDYNAAKDRAREIPGKSSSSAMHAFNDAGNAFKKIGKKQHHHTRPDPRFAASVFDWDNYYDTHSDVVKAGVDLPGHWRDSGFLEGRQGSAEFMAPYYWQRYSDVQALCPRKDLQCALQHWLDIGSDQGRQGSLGFSSASYLSRYPDLQAQLGTENYGDALEDWMNTGEDAGRDGHPDSPADGPISGPTAAGGGGGTAWTDADTCANGAVIGFKLRTGGNVDGVQFKYGAVGGAPAPGAQSSTHTTSVALPGGMHFTMPKPGSRGWAPARGYQGGNPTTEVVLAEGETIVRVDYTRGGVMTKLRFVTNTGKSYGPYGSNGGTACSYEVTPGQQLGCMSGRAGGSIDQMSFASTGAR